MTFAGTSANGQDAPTTAIRFARHQTAGGRHGGHFLTLVNIACASVA